MLPGILAILALAAVQAPLSLTFRGQITTDLPAQSIRVVLENPKVKDVGSLTTVTDKDGNFEFRNLSEREYRLVVWLDGKKQEKRDLEVVCRPGGVMRKDFFYGKMSPTLMFYFPAEDPDMIDVAELQGDYPKDVLKEYERAFEDYTNGNVIRAAQRLEAIVVRAPRFYGAHSRLGMIYQQSGCYTEAQAEYEIASALSPRSAHPLVNLASAQIQAAEEPQGRELMITRALDSLNRALEIRPSSAIAHCLSGAVYVKASSYEDAEKSFKRALDIDSDMAAARLMLANLYLRQKKWDDAIEHLNTYLEDHPNASDRAVVKELRAEAERARN